MDLLNLSHAALKMIRDGKLKNVINLFWTVHTLNTEPAYVYSWPFRLYIEPTTRCNLECRMCYQAALVRPKKDLSFDNFLEILSHFPSLQDLQLQGIGEPLLNPDIFRMIEYAKTKKIRVGLFSNATLISQNTAKNIIGSGLDWINLSLDGAGPNTYEKIRKGANFEEVIGNIKTLMRMKRNKKPPKVSLWFTAMKMNTLELPAIIRLAKSLGVGSVTAQGMHFWGDDFLRDNLKKESLRDEIVLIKETFIQSALEAKKSKVRLDFRPLYFEKRTKRICRWPWVSCFITVEGFVTPCCVQGCDLNMVNFGNVFDKNFKDIWNSPPYQNFRNRLKSNDPPEICRDCPGYYYK